MRPRPAGSSGERFPTSKATDASDASPHQTREKRLSAKLTRLERLVYMVSENEKELEQGGAAVEDDESEAVDSLTWGDLTDYRQA